MGNNRKMDNIIKFTDNKKFIRWVKYPTDELDVYWANYLKDNPKEIMSVEAARLIVEQLGGNNTGLSQSETDTLFDNIMEGVEKKRLLNKNSFLNLSLLKYAAAIIVLISLAISYTLIRNHNDFSSNVKGVLASNLLEYENIVLTLGDGSEITIDKRTATVKYLSEQQFVINNTDTISTRSSAGNIPNRLIVPLGKNATILLSDGTRVFINAESQFIYPDAFNSNNRETYLVGEAFFEVAHNKEHPFFVKTSSVDVQVLGTKFNVCAYPGDSIVETFLVEGKVRVVENKKLITKKEETIKPKQSAIFDKEKDLFKVEDITNPEYVTWYKGYLNFSSTKLSSIVSKLERYYNVNIEVKDSTLGNKLISGKLILQDESEETVIKVLANAASLNAIKENTNTYILE